MTDTVEATFSIDAWDETPYDEPAEGPKLTRVTIRKSYEGRIEGYSVAEVLTTQGAKGSGFVASERVIGTLDGRAGTFVIQHGGLDDGAGGQSTWGTIIANSGTGELAAIAGEATEAQPGVLSLRLRSS